MMKRSVFTGLAGGALAVAAMPATACPGKGVGFANPVPPTRVAVVATTDGFAIVRKTGSSAAPPRAPVPLGVQTKIDLAAFECSARRLVSARP